MCAQVVLLIETVQNPVSYSIQIGLQNIVSVEVGKSVIDEYLRRKGLTNPSGSNPQVPTSKLQTYVKPPQSESSSSGTKKPFKALKDATIANKNLGSHVPTEATS